jgi:uncharacterized membrane protein
MYHKILLASCALIYLFLGMLVSACAHMLVSAQGSPECYLFGGMAYLLVDSLELVTAYVLGRIYQCKVKEYH